MATHARVTCSEVTSVFDFGLDFHTRQGLVRLVVHLYLEGEVPLRDIGGDVLNFLGDKFTNIEGACGTFDEMIAEVELWLTFSKGHAPEHHHGDWTTEESTGGETWHNLHQKSSTSRPAS